MEKETYHFENVHLFYEKRRGHFTFKIKEVSYFLGFLENEERDKVTVVGIMHIDGLCPFCREYTESNDQLCRSLFDEKENIFEMLLKHPSVRLKWLFEKEREKGEKGE